LGCETVRAVLTAVPSGAEILQSLKDMKAGKGQVVLSSATEAREATGLSQSQFARLLGVSVRTLQGWEQGRKQPSGAARTLLAIAKSNPKAILMVSADCRRVRLSTRRTYSPG